MYNDISQCCVPLSASLLDAMRVIDQAAVGIAMVVDETGCLKGTLTDGDVRRVLLQGNPLDAPLEPHIVRDFTSVDPSEGRNEVVELMQARVLSQVPIVDKSGKLLGLHLLREIMGVKDRPNWAVIMAGGKGTRLRPITEHLPKPMISVAGRPILERLVLHLVGFGIKRIFISVNYKSEMIMDHFGDGKDFGCKIEYLEENEPLGTGGALSLLPEIPKEPMLVMNGDIVTQMKLSGIFSFHTAGQYCATMAVNQYNHQIPYGCIEADEQGKITNLIEKPTLTQWVNAGIYVIAPEVLAQVPKRFFPITELFEECMSQDKPVGAFVINDEWIDVGEPQELKRAQGV